MKFRNILVQATLRVKFYFIFFLLYAISKVAHNQFSLNSKFSILLFPRKKKYVFHLKNGFVYVFFEKYYLDKKLKYIS